MEFALLTDTFLVALWRLEVLRIFHLTNRTV